MIDEKKKKKLPLSGFCWFDRFQRENKRKKRIDKYLDLARELNKKPGNMIVTVISVLVDAL